MPLHCYTRFSTLKPHRQYHWAITLKENGDKPIGTIHGLVNDDLEQVTSDIVSDRHGGIRESCLRHCRRSLIFSLTGWDRTVFVPTMTRITLIPEW